MLNVGTLGLLIAVVASLACRLHWSFDLATHFRAQYAMAGLVLALGYLLRRQWRTAAVPLLLSLVNLVYIAPFYLPHDEPSAPPPEATRLKVIAMNVFAGSRAYDEVIAYIRAEQPDIVVFSELTQAWQAGLQPLADEYPERRFVARNDPFGLGLIAKRSLTNVRFDPLGEQPYARATFDVDGRTVTLFGIHPPPPIGSRLATMRNEAFVALKGFVRDVDGPTIVVGDFNSTSWSPHFADLLAGTNLRDTRLGRGLQPSWSMTHPAPLHIPIDHMLVSPEVYVFERRLGPRIGSDHLPVEMEIALRP